MTGPFVSFGRLFSVGLVLAVLVAFVSSQTALDCEICKQVAEAYPLAPEGKPPTSQCKKLQETLWKKLEDPSILSLYTNSVVAGCSSPWWDLFSTPDSPCTDVQASELCTRDKQLKNLGNGDRQCCIALVKSIPRWIAGVCNTKGSSRPERHVVKKCLSLHTSLKHKYIDEGGLTLGENSITSAKAFCHQFKKLKKHSLSSCRLPRSFTNNQLAKDIDILKLGTEDRSVAEVATGGLRSLIAPVAELFGSILEAINRLPRQIPAALTQEEGSKRSNLILDFVTDFLDSSFRDDETKFMTYERQWQYILEDGIGRIKKHDELDQIAMESSRLYDLCLGEIERSHFSSQDIFKGVEEDSLISLTDGIKWFYSEDDRKLAKEIEEGTLEILERLQSEKYYKLRRSAVETGTAVSVSTLWKPIKDMQFSNFWTDQKNELEKIQGEMVNMEAILKRKREQFVEAMKIMAPLSVSSHVRKPQELEAATTAYGNYVKNARLPPFAGFIHEFEEKVGNLKGLLKRLGSVLSANAEAAQVTGSGRLESNVRSFLLLNEFLKNEKESDVRFDLIAKMFDSACAQWYQDLRWTRLQFLEEVHGVLVTDGYKAITPVYNLSITAKVAAAKERKN